LSSWLFCVSPMKTTIKGIIEPKLKISFSKTLN
jgi:hypothetical protein